MQFDLARKERESHILCLLKACAEQADLGKGHKLHAYIQEHKLLEKSCQIASSLVSMYARCGAIAKAQQVLDELPFRDVVTWNALIAGCAHQGQNEEALECFEIMLCEGHRPTAITFICALQTCASMGASVRGENIHEMIVKQGILEKSIVLGSTLMDMYARCGALSKAQQILKQLPARDVVMWNTLITRHTQEGQSKEALRCFDNMQREGHSPDAISFSCALKACGNIGSAAKGEKIHHKITSMGMLHKDAVLGNTLVDMYVRCGALAKAHQVLDELDTRNVVSWNILIAGYAEQDEGEEALKCFSRMQHEGHPPSLVTFICTLKACGTVRTAGIGEQIHDKIANFGMLEKDIVLGSTLVDMYARFGTLAKAQLLLEELPSRNVVTWNALISGYTKQGKGEEALKCFDRMQDDGQAPSAVTFICALRACGSIGAATKGEMLYEKIVNSGMLEKHILFGSMVVDMYARCGAVAKAQQVLDELPVRDVIMWNALIRGYVEQGYAEEALKCFKNMQDEGHSPDALTFMCTLKASVNIGAASNVEEIYEKIVSLGMLDKNIVLGSALMNMYARCAALAKTVELFEKLPFWNVVTWNALIRGYAEQGQSGEALKCFKIMQSVAVRPDSATLVCIFNACSHSGLLDQAQMVFWGMSIDYGLTPTVDHYSCIVDLFGRAGVLDKALLMIESMPSDDCFLVWSALLGACHKWQNVRTGRLAFKHALLLDNNNTAAYVCMANIYTAAGMGHIETLSGS